MYFQSAFGVGEWKKFLKELQETSPPGPLVKLKKINLNHLIQVFMEEVKRFCVKYQSKINFSFSPWRSSCMMCWFSNSYVAASCTQDLFLNGDNHFELMTMLGWWFYLLSHFHIPFAFIYLLQLQIASRSIKIRQFTFQPSRLKRKLP